MGGLLGKVDANVHADTRVNSHVVGMERGAATANVEANAHMHPGAITGTMHPYAMVATMHPKAIFTKIIYSGISPLFIFGTALLFVLLNGTSWVPTVVLIEKVNADVLFKYVCTASMMYLFYTNLFAEYKKKPSDTTNVGTIQPYAGATPPYGWLLCDGSRVDVENRPELIPLARVLGTAYDPADRAVVLPNCRGRVLTGASPTHRLGSYFGDSTMKLTVAHLPPHTHSGTTNHEVESHTHEEFCGANFGSGGTGIRTTYNADGAGASAYPMKLQSGPASNHHTHPFTTDSTGEGKSFSLEQPSVSVNYIIKY